MALPLTADATWVFIGDSITDCGRRGCPEFIGGGYVRLIRDWLAAREPATAPRVVNSGIGGNKIPDLQGRWQDDVLAHKPSLLSIKIGINDVWHGLNPGGVGTSVENFRAGYVDILDQTKSAFPGVTLVLCEPSVIWPPAPAVGNETLIPYIETVRELAEKYGAILVPLHAAFNDARQARPDLNWTTDGVHPTSTGHMLLARTWLAALGLL